MTDEIRLRQEIDQEIFNMERCIVEMQEEVRLLVNEITMIIEKKEG